MNTVDFKSFNSTPTGSEEAAQAATETAAEASSNTCTPASTPPQESAPQQQQVPHPPQSPSITPTLAKLVSSPMVASNIENDKPEPSNMSHSTSNPVAGAASASPPPAAGLKVFTPVISQDTKNTNRQTTQKLVNRKKRPIIRMSDVNWIDEEIPLSTPDQLKEQSRMDSLKDEQQARDLLVWNDGIGTLYGCDLRFKLNQLGCLELLDSDDESENTLKSQNAIAASSAATTTFTKPTSNINTTNTRSNSQNKSNYHLQKNNSQRNHHTTNNTATNGVPSLDHFSSNTGSKTAETFSVPSISNQNNRKNRQDSSEQSSSTSTSSSSSNVVRQISPGSSLLRDGPDMKRPKLSGSSFSSSVRQNQQALAKKLQQTQNSIVLEKLVSKQKLEEINSNCNVEHWTIEDVKKFVDCIPGCAGHGELFESQQICGKSLMYLDQKDLLDVINVKLGPAVKIYHAISLLK